MFRLPKGPSKTSTIESIHKTIAQLSNYRPMKVNRVKPVLKKCKLVICPYCGHSPVLMSPIMYGHFTITQEVKPTTCTMTAVNLQVDHKASLYTPT